MTFKGHSKTMESSWFGRKCTSS